MNKLNPGWWPGLPCLPAPCRHHSPGDYQARRIVGWMAIHESYTTPPYGHPMSAPRPPYVRPALSVLLSAPNLNEMVGPERWLQQQWQQQQLEHSATWLRHGAQLTGVKHLARGSW